MKEKKMLPAQLNICIVKPNEWSYSESYIESHVKKLPGNKKTVFGGYFPLFTHNLTYMIKSRTGLLIYLVSKRLLRMKEIGVRTRAFASYLTRHRRDIVLAEYGITGALVREACAIASVPLVIHFHGGDASDRKILKEYASLYKKAFAYAGRIVVPSSHTRENLLKIGAPAEKITYLKYGIDLNFFTPVQSSANPLIFISVARFVEKKAPLITIAAFNKVLARFPAAQLIMIGEGPLLEGCKITVNELGISARVNFLGMQNAEEVAVNLRNARVFVQHSVTTKTGETESTPNSILEAAATGLPIVSTRHAGIKEAVLDETTGYLVDEHDIADMSEKMILLANDPKTGDKMGKAGRDYMEQHHDQRLQLDKLSKILFEVYRAAQ